MPDSALRTFGRRAAQLVLVGALAATPLAITGGIAEAKGGTNWDAVAQCESSGNWKINSGNGYSGGLQFKQSTWNANGGKGRPHQASKAEQIRVAENIKKSQGMKAWPVCGKKG